MRVIASVEDPAVIGKILDHFWRGCAVLTLRPFSQASTPGRATPLYTDSPAMMAIAPDGGTMFIAGRDAVIVQPVP